MKTISIRFLSLCIFNACLLMSAPCSPTKTQERGALKQKEYRPDLTLIGPVRLADGIGRQAADLALALKDDLKIQLIPAPYQEKHLSRDLIKLITVDQPPLGKVVIFEGGDLRQGLHCLKDIPSDLQIRIAYSMLESTRIPPSMTAELNTCFDAVVVPDPFLIAVYQDSGVTIPIFSIPLGLQFSQFLEAPLKTERKDPLVFGNLSAGIPRKNHLRLIESFAKALGNNPHAILKINSRGGNDLCIHEIEEKVALTGCSNILFTNRSLSQEEYLNFFKEIDCYVSLSRGEGFSIQPREAMALGIPAIVTNNTGQTTICSSGLVRTVLSNIPIPASCAGFNQALVGEQFDCTLEDASNALLDMFDHYEKYLEKGSEARKWASRYSYSNNELKQLYKSLVMPEKIILGEENRVSPDGLTTNSERLFNKYLKLIKPPYQIN